MANTVGKHNYLESVAWGFSKRAIFDRLKRKFEASPEELVYSISTKPPNISHELGFATQTFEELPLGQSRHDNRMMTLIFRAHLVILRDLV